LLKNIAWSWRNAAFGGLLVGGESDPCHSLKVHARARLPDRAGLRNRLASAQECLATAVRSLG
jgi:hypothetical protein